jgi:uncharacterized protein (DUF2235 family)
MFKLDVIQEPCRSGIRGMTKNIVIFSDGTGQRGGVLFDERRSNIYKLYRATRCGPDSSVDPERQHAYYDPGIGTVPKGSGLIGGAWQWVYNLVSQATGLGLTKNIIDCYAEIIRHWKPGDRIYLMGFSRGAYTARCVAAVVGFCGVPTRMRDGSPLKRDEATCRKIAERAVKDIYQHVSSPKDKEYAPQRQALAARFREQFASGTPDGANVYPHFIGVFDTVAAVANYASLALAGGLWLIAALALSAILHALAGGFLWWLGATAVLSAAVAFIFFLSINLKWATGLPGYSFWQTLHLTGPRMRFMDQNLNPKVGWARHAIAIDEHRKDFDRVPWGIPSDWQAKEPPWFKQLWFAGCHSDIGGSYPEAESRLSDIALKWMVDEAKAIPDGLLVDDSVLRLYPSPRGMQHDESKTGVFRFAARFTRPLRPDAPLHPSVVERFAVGEVLHHDFMAPYRPEALRGHEKVNQFYGQSQFDKETMT